MSKYLIVVEGKADAVFIMQYLYFIFRVNFEFIKSPKTKKIKIGIPINVFKNPDAKVLISGGCTHLEKIKNILLEFQDEGYRIIFAQDADDPTKDFGGIERRIHFLENKKIELGVAFDIFLFPNHNNDGDLETLLLSIVKEDKYNPFHFHYGNYIDFTNELNEGAFSHELQDNKMKVFNYLQVYTGMEKAREENREYDTSHWDLSNISLEPLQLFFKKIIT